MSPPIGSINFRIGVHIGDVMVRAGDLFGDGVNIAARLQTLADPGAVCISGATYDQIRKVLPNTFVDLGVQRVKNIQEAIRAYQVGAPSETREAAPARVAEVEGPPPLPNKPSIAVLPFQNMSGDPEQEHFADGIAEDLITNLSRMGWIFVIARTSSFGFKGQRLSAVQIAQQLGVHYVVEGSIRKSTNRMRITVQLTEGSRGTQIWTRRFDRPVDDVFAVQEEIADIITATLERQPITLHRILRRRSSFGIREVRRDR